MAIGDGVVRLEELRPGDHVCWAYTSDASYAQGLARYITDGLLSAQRVACFPDDRRSRQVVGELQSLVPGFDEAVSRGALILGDFDSAYMPDGDFDPDQRIGSYAAMAEQARADGFDGLRVMGEPSTLMSDPVARERWPGYEVRADLLTRRKQLIALCAFDTSRLDADAARLLRGVHGASFGAWDREPVFFIHAEPGGALALGGEVDFGGADDLARIVSAAAPDLVRPAVDVSELRFVDVAGMRGILKALRVVARDHGRVQVRGARPGFRRLWALLGCEHLVDAELEPA